MGVSSQQGPAGWRQADTHEVDLRCPLCRGTEAQRVATYEYSAIWRSLEEVWRARFSRDVIERHSPAQATLLFECDRCKLQYFALSVAGDAHFYAELMSSVDYVEQRWEFERLQERLGGAQSMIDLGCGDGAHLRGIRELAPHARIVGVDHNSDAIARLRADGIEAYAANATHLSSMRLGLFDVVCAFQILEHMADPAALVSAARDLLAPKGRLFIAVPNRNRAGRESLEPFDCPPHHMTRWSADQFEYLARAHNLTLVSVTYQEPAAWSVRRSHRQAAERILAPLGPRTASYAGQVYGRLRVLTLWHNHRVRGGTYVGRSHFGHTMLAELRRAS